MRNEKIVGAILAVFLISGFIISQEKKVEKPDSLKLSHF
jgi:hypothetical protein